VAGVLFLVGVVAVGAIALWVRDQVDPGGRPGGAVVVDVPMGASAGSIATTLDRRGVIGSARAFRLYVRVKGAGPFQSGSYRLRRRASFAEIVATLERGPEETFDRLTIPEGLTLQQVAERIGRLPGRSAQRFLEVAQSGVVRSRYQPPEVNSLEGLLLPETYHLEPRDDEQAILARMVSTFDQAAAQEGLDQVTQGGLVNPYQAIVVASMVEREAKVPEDRGMVARVIYNRLRERQLLEVDATVIYALGRTGEPGLRLLEKDLEVQSPYNTYKVPGLPPTPIASPGRAALQAAIDPPDGPWRYYVVVEPTGKHAFAATLDEHNRNIALARSRGVR
jgi:UPF0755 protein